MKKTTQIGPTKGSLILVGGGYLKDTAIAKRFILLAGGPNAQIVIIPTAGDADSYGHSCPYMADLIEAGGSHFTILHTRDPKVADTDEFVKPLQEADGVWFSGGRQWRLADSYLNTKTHEALQGVLDRGGVIGGSSAGASMMGSFLGRGDTKTNEIIIGDHTEGFGFLRNVVLDQHLLKRNRHFDLIDVVQKYPDLLGIGLDEDTAIVVTGDEFEVIGNSYVAIYDNQRQLASGGKFYFLSSGDHYNLQSREATHFTEEEEPIASLIEKKWQYTEQGQR